MVPLNLEKLFLYQPDNTVTDNNVHSSKWRKSGCSRVHSSCITFFQFITIVFLLCFNKEGGEASHTEVVFQTQSKQNTQQMEPDNEILHQRQVL